MTVQVETSARARLSPPGEPLWGDFGGMCLAGTCRVTPDLFMPGTTAMGLPKSSVYLIGALQTDDGASHQFLRGIDGWSSAAVITVFSNRNSDRLAAWPDVDARMYRGGITSRYVGGKARYSAANGGAFGFATDVDTAHWTEGELLDLAGSLVAPATQWFNPWRNGEGAYVVTLKYRVSGTLLAQPCHGFVAVECHFFPPRQNFLASPFGFGGREVHWGHMATAFADGSVIDANVAVGTDGWGFAVLTDESGRTYATTDLEVHATVRSNGYPDRIVYRFLDQEWAWEILDRGERANIVEMPGLPIGAEGVFRRVGDDREVVASMGTIDWWTDGRETTVTSV